MAKQSLKKPDTYDSSAVDNYLREIFDKTGKTYTHDTLADAMRVESRDTAGRYVRGDYKTKHWTARHIENILGYLGLTQDGEESKRLYDLIAAKPTNNVSTPDTTTPNVGTQHCYLPEFAEEYYYELQLAEPAPPFDDKKSDGECTLRELRHFSKNINTEGSRWHNPLNAKQRFMTIISQESDAVHVILGESGGGKTTLLNKWAHDAYADYCKGNSKLFPIYMRLRELGNSQDKNVSLTTYYKCLTSENIDIQPFLDKRKKALWLFDGWDELPEGAKKSWVSYINSLAGHKVVSCRVLRYKHDFSAAKEYLIYGLSRQQQKEYLQKILPSFTNEPQKYRKHGAADATWVDELLRKLNSQENSRLYQLAISPLLLRLIAETNPPHHIRLPDNRTEFYHRAFKERLNWENRLDDRKLEEARIAKLKNASASIANQAGLTFIFSGNVISNALQTIEHSDGIQTELVEAGILQEVGENYEFLHATFHEWALAHYLAQQENPLVSAVQTYWSDPSYDEVVALLWGNQTINTTQRQEATTLLHQNMGCIEQKNNLNYRRSGIKQSIVYWELSGLTIPEDIATEIWRRISPKAELRYALAALIDFQKNSFFGELLQKDMAYIAANLSKNPYLSNELMLRLSRNVDIGVKRDLASNPNLSDEAMWQLADDESKDVRWALAQNPYITAEIKAYLSEKDRYSDTWRRLAPEKSTLVEQTLQELENRKQYEEFARSAEVKTNQMLKLVKHKDMNVRILLAARHDIDEKIALALAQDAEKNVRRILAGNTNLSTSIMKLLAKDSANDVCEELALNPSINLEIMRILATSEDDDAKTQKTRENLALNPHVCWEIFL